MTKRNLKIGTYIKHKDNKHTFLYIDHIERDRVYGYRMIHIGNDYYSQGIHNRFNLTLKNYNVYKPKGNFRPRIENFP
jgi:hypothetical protein